MPRTSGLDNRLARLEVRQGHAGMASLAHTLAGAAGISVQELLAEAEWIAQVCSHHGISSWGGMVRHWAAALGMTPEELERELARYREWTP